MKTYTLQTVKTQEVLFEGTFPSFKDCLESAVRKKITLDNVDLRHKNLSHANLDNAVMPGADFSHSNLNGVNLSESHLRGAVFKNATLHGACLCYSNLSECIFEDSSFGATDIFGAILGRARFSTLSCFSLNFSAALHMEECLFVDAVGTLSKMSYPPVVIHGLSHHPLIILDQDIKEGHTTIKRESLHALSQKLSARLRLSTSEKQSTIG
ncbi:MAG: pentapeptide repeat-containing protein [Alphaproteobacteria bacterium]|nr:pentapeptide repeat-containing protein [Alphaproteobacteria bacterium]